MLHDFFRTHLQGHSEEVCGLQWSPDGIRLASGGNDNVLRVWDHASLEKPRHVLRDSKAAVKAIGWCPFNHDILAAGGGSSDKHLRIYNASSGQLLTSVNTGSQVTGVLWAPHEKELLTSHGFSQNQLTLWNFPTLTPIAHFTGHSQRILSMTMNSDGTNVCTCSSDETLRFWNVWQKRASAVDTIDPFVSANSHSKGPKTPGSARRHLTIR